MAACSGCGGSFIDASLLTWAESALPVPLELLLEHPPDPPAASVERSPAPAALNRVPAAAAPAEPVVLPVQPARPQPRARSPRNAIVAAGGLVVVLVMIAVTRLALSIARPAPPAVSDTAWRDAPIAQPPVDNRRPDEGGPTGASAQDRQVAVQQAAPARSDAPPPPERLFGGRALVWWKARLTRLRKEPGQSQGALYEATLRAARANGLVVAETGDDVSVSLPAPAPVGQETR